MIYLGPRPDRRRTPISRGVPPCRPLPCVRDRSSCVRGGPVPSRIEGRPGRHRPARRPSRRVVSLAPSLTEIVFLLGRGGSLVGVTRFCNVPAAASGLPKIGGVSDPDVERIVALLPDLVLCTTDGNPRDKVRALEEMGIPCFAVAPQDLDAVFTAIERLGVLLGAADRGRAEAGALRRRARLASPSSRDAEKPAVLFVVSTAPIIAAGEGTFMDELVRLAGGRNAAARFSGRYPRLSLEGWSPPGRT